MLNQENRYLFKFAWKSIQRNAGRSFFIGFSISLAVIIAVWVVAFFDGLNHQIEKAVVNTNTGYIQIQDPLYAKNTDASHALEFDSKLRDLFSQNPIQSFSPELILDGNISTPEGAAGLTVIGIEPQYHQKFLPIYRKISAGHFLTSNDSQEIVIGKELADLFKFRVGDQLVLNYQDINGELRSEILNIKGIYHYNAKGFEKKFVYINQQTWQGLFFNKVSDKILFNRIGLMVPGLEEKSHIKKMITGLPLKMKTWKNLNPEMAVILDFHNGMIRFFFVIIAITILMTILTPVRMLWQERFKELRMMSIIGVSLSKFWKIGLFEIIQMVFLSSIFSSVLLIIVIGIQSHTGIDFSSLNDGVAIERAGIRLPGTIYPQLTPVQIIITFIFVGIILSISYLWSIYRTLKKLEAEI